MSVMNAPLTYAYEYGKYYVHMYIAYSDAIN